MNIDTNPESILLGILIRDSLPLPDTLVAADFQEPKNQDIALVMSQLRLEHILPDEVTVTVKLRESGSPVEAYYVSQLVSSVGFMMYQPAQADAIKKSSTVRRVRHLITALGEQANNPGADPDKLITDFQNGLKNIAEDKTKNDGPELLDINALLTFDRNADPNNVIGNRWLTKGASMIISGQSGTGKSALMMTAAINWALGTQRGFFGIKSIKPLKTLCLQAENDLGDVGESMQDMCNGLNLSLLEKDTLSEQMKIYRESSATGEKFGKLLRDLILAHKAEIAFIDPLLAYAGCDLGNIADASNFCRSIIQPILHETGCIAVFMHHTGKPKSKADKEGYTQADNSYDLIGSSDLTNWAREIMTLKRCQGEEPIYRLTLNKRRHRSGMTDNNGNFSPEIFIRHSPERGIIRWERSQPPPPPSEAESTESRKSDSKRNSKASF